MYDLIVLGGGSGGLSVATASARVGGRVALVENHRLGGECTHSACVPSKALIHAARLAHQFRSAERFGIKTTPPEIDFGAVMDRVRAVVAEFAGSGSGDSLRRQGIDVFHASPAFEAYDTVVLDGKTRLHSRRFVIATGSRPEVPRIPGLEEAGYLTNRTVWALSQRPETLVVVGGGPVGIELAQAFARLGSKVKVVTHSDRLLPHEDPEASAYVQSRLAAEGLTIKTGVEVTGVSLRAGQKVVALKDKTSRDTFEAAGSHILVATGRLANVEGLNLETIGVEADPRHGIKVNERLQTYAPRIYAIGDVLQRDLYTHAAEREADVVFQNAVLRLSKKWDDRALPRATFIDPEVAAVGLSERDAREQSIEVRVFRAEFSQIDRARIDGRTEGFAKVVVKPSGTILGATIVGPDAALVLQEFVLAMEHGLKLDAVASTVHAYPTNAGIARNLANQFAATRLKGGVVQAALQGLLGFRPRNQEE